MKPIQKRVIVFGNSGSGKSTFAKKLAAEYRLVHLDLDTLAWQATDPPTRKPISESQQATELFMTSHDSWVVEGCYTDLLRLFTEQANQAVFMNLPVSLCQQNAKQRPWEAHKYHSKAAQDANLAMLLDWIADYPNRNDEFSYQAHAMLYNQFRGSKQQITENLTSDSEMRT